MNGKMSQIIAEMMNEYNDFEVVCGIDYSSKKVAHPFPVYLNPFEYRGDVDLIIDFSHPSYLNQLLDFARDKKAAIIIGTTGLSDEQEKFIKQVSKDIPILYSANMSLGITLINHILKSYGNMLGSLFDIEIIKMHHNMKLDAPSGTAYMLANTLNESLNHGRTFVFGREGQRLRESNEMGIHAIRGGTIRGSHTILFAGNDEVIHIIHEAQSRKVYGHGALIAGLILVEKPPGLYTMDDLLGISQMEVENDESFPRGL